MTDVLIATRNAHKVQEISQLLAGTGVRLISLADIPCAPPVEEDQPTFKGNAEKKALSLARHTGLLAVADDSGLQVDALDGAPGIYSARYAGPGATDAQNNAKLLAALRNVPYSRRGACFVCCVALATPPALIGTVTGSCRGIIVEHLSGGGGFGYDPLFYLPQRGKTFAQMAAAEKNRLSHRGKAFAKFKKLLLRHCAAVANQSCV